MSVSVGPERFRVALPEDAGPTRLGKIRLGRRVEKTSSRTGRQILVPEKTDHFVVVEDESEITSAAAVEAFHRVYPDAPRQIHCMLIGETPEDNLEGAWRLYNQSKLKRRCNGETCSERTATGGWETKPCACAAQGIPDDADEHCSLDWTFTVVLPDVDGWGVWIVDTGSTISVRRLTGFLRLAHSLRTQAGQTLAGYEFDLRLVPVTVNPNGVKGTVYILDPVDFSRSPRAALDAGAAPLPQLPAPVGGVVSPLDEERDPLVQPTAEERETAAAAASSSAAAAEPAPLSELEALAVECRAMFTRLSKKELGEVGKLIQDAGIDPKPRVLVQEFGAHATRFLDLKKALRARIRKLKADAVRAERNAAAAASTEKTPEESAAAAAQFQAELDADAAAREAARVAGKGTEGEASQAGGADAGDPPAAAATPPAAAGSTPVVEAEDAGTDPPAEDEELARWAGPDAAEVSDEPPVGQTLLGGETSAYGPGAPS